MRLLTLVLYLFGNRNAILQLAANRWSLAVGALFVLSAGLARDYDQEDLLHEPWHLLLPFVASSVTSTVLFTMAIVIYEFYKDRSVKSGPDGLDAYASFLGLFWLTAPLAWAYAIPYERYLPPADAVRMNLTTLGLVAVWRVALMVRVLMVLFGFAFFDAFILVMIVADAAALAASVVVPMPLLELMSGNRYSEGDIVLRETAGLVLCAGLCSAPLWLIALAFLGKSGTPHWAGPRTRASERPRVTVWVASMGSVVVGLCLLPITQPEQMLRHRVEEAFREGRTKDAIAEMSAHDLKDFPPHWQPPPRYVDQGEKGAEYMAALEVIADRPPAPWVRDIYMAKLNQIRFNWLSEDLRLRWKNVLRRLPEGAALLEEIDRTGIPDPPRSRKGTRRAES